MHQEAVAAAVLMFVVLVVLIIILYTGNKNETEVMSAVAAENSLEMEQEVLELVNDVRSKGATCGDVYKPPVQELEWNEQLRNAAEGHSRDMADKNYFSHTSPDGKSFVDRINRAGYTGYRTVGENIAAGYGTAASVMEGWMRSPGHCNNIMNPAFREMGVGYAYNSGSQYKQYWTQNFGSKL